MFQFGIQPDHTATAVAHLAEPVEKNGSGQCVAGLALIQSGMNTAAQLDVLQPIQGEQAALDTAQFTERHRQPVLTRVAAQLAHH